MSTRDKAKKRIAEIPNNYTFAEVRFLLGKLGFQEYNKGKTSGSRVKFYRESDQRVFMFHKPHRGDSMDRGAVEDLVRKLKEMGEL